MGERAVEPSSHHTLPITASPDTDLHYNGYLRESPMSILNPSTRSKPESWWRAQCILYHIPMGKKATMAELHASLESAVNKLGEIRVVEEILEEAVECRREGNERVWKVNMAVRGIIPVEGKDALASAKESVVGSVIDGGKGEGEKVGQEESGCSQGCQVQINGQQKGCKKGYYKDRCFQNSQSLQEESSENPGCTSAEFPARGESRCGPSGL